MGRRWGRESVGLVGGGGGGVRGWGGAGERECWVGGRSWGGVRGWEEVGERVLGWWEELGWGKRMGRRWGRECWVGGRSWGCGKRMGREC